MTFVNQQCAACPGGRHIQSAVHEPVKREGFSDGKPHIATAEDLKRPWGGVRDGSRFRCYLCGHRFVVGDVYRWQFTNNIPGASGNPFVCEACDGPDVIERWKAMHDEWTRDSGGKWWWFVDQEVIPWRAARGELPPVSDACSSCKLWPDGGCDFGCPCKDCAEGRKYEAFVTKS